jgi:hypothetical protein
MTKPFENYSYEIHTNNELYLMLSGRKPMAVFCDGVGHNTDITNGQDFAKYVNSGLIKKTIFYISNSNQNFKIIYYVYTMPGEDWRAELYKQLKKNGQSKWCQDMEIMEGTLLGYSIDENMEHIRLRYRLT